MVHSRAHQSETRDQSAMFQLNFLESLRSHIEYRRDVRE